MCGLFGLLDGGKNLPYRKKKDLIQSLACFSIVRGEDATGYAFVKNQELLVKKKATVASNFGPGRVRSNIILGHTRLATYGDPTLDKNAHPFISRDGRYAFAHNGEAHEDFEALAKEKKIPPMDSQVDSEAMFRYLEKDGFEVDALSKFYSTWKNSTFAISILDSKKSSLILFHNNTNKIVGFFINPQTFVYASTAQILSLALLKENISHDMQNFIHLKPFVKHEILLSGEHLMQDIPVEEEVKNIFEGQNEV